MKSKSIFILLLAWVFFAGCSSKSGPGSLLGYSSSISTEEVNEAFSKAFPIQKKSSFGTVSLKRALLKPTSQSDRVALSVAFGLTSFEIPEGIEGTMALSAGLRYDPRSKKIYLKEVTPVGMQFGDTALSKYISKSARSAVNVIAMRELSNIVIYQVKESFSARFIKNITVNKGKIVIQYGL